MTEIEPSRSTQRVLVVEDDHMLSRMLDIWIGTLLGYQVSVAHDGLSAVEMALSEHPDVVLMDLRLPGIDGLEATRRIKADVATQDIPIVAFSNERWDSAWTKSAFDAGCVRCVDKIMSIPELDALLLQLTHKN